MTKRAAPTQAHTIRELRDKDIEPTIALWHAAGIARPWNNPIRDIELARRGPHSTLLIAEEAGCIVGSVMVGEDGHRGWVYSLAVDPSRQGSGLGRTLMDAAEAWLRQRGIWKVQLLVRAGNEGAKRFYERLGYADGASTCFQKVIR